jgi:hypothetical protein
VALPFGIKVASKMCMCVRLRLSIALQGQGGRIAHAPVGSAASQLTARWIVARRLHNDLEQEGGTNHGPF